MKMASLDGLRGYAQNHYGEVQQYRTTDYVPKSSAGGYQVLREPFWNKGLSRFFCLHPLSSTRHLLPKMHHDATSPLNIVSLVLTNTNFTGLSFTPEDRVAKNLTGLIPHAMENVDTQVARCMKMINTRQTNIDKYMYLSSLKDQNIDLFYRVLIDNVRDLMPLVYTPTIGDVCLQYSTLYTRPEALYISIKQRKSIRTILRNWPYPNPEICVVTDGSRILGLGDLGVNGVGISVSQLALCYHWSVPTRAVWLTDSRSGNWPYTPAPRVSIPSALCQLFWTAAPPTRTT